MHWNRVCLFDAFGWFFFLPGPPSCQRPTGLTGSAAKMFGGGLLSRCFRRLLAEISQAAELSGLRFVRQLFATRASRNLGGLPVALVSSGPSPLIFGRR
ncbi:hypothetical protein F4821DRAFT_227399 [Hypoxylon rubiginosum]|uniref:Uncharacterized protein n=1 Tax=Hypoxylon rubiginosum TaxID=110542 RepID=A0ACC0DED6_9PEZI|nr:hypothetical protein F4821DRAFT_227399 [Hypoxylon rubiginosum]